MTENNMFNEGSTDTSSYLDQLVGEGKQYKTVEELAKAAVFKESHIKTLEGENANLRSERDSLKAVKTVEVPKPAEGTPVTTPPSAPTEIDLDKKILDVMTEAQKKDRAKANVQEVETKMLELFGSQEKAGEVIQQKARELGVSPSFLQSTAASSPNAFYNLIGLNAPNVSPAAPKSAVNTLALRDTHSGSEPKQNTYKWFVKTYGNPGKWSTSVQNQVHSAVFELGEDAFYA